MQLIINIPKEFEKDFNSDKFKDCLNRVLMDCKGLNYEGLTGRYEHETLEMFIKAFENAKESEKAIESMKTVMGWIPVSDRMPIDGSDVLFCDIDGTIYVGYHRKGEPRTRFADLACGRINNVVAWRELPTPYVESEEND